MEFNGFSDGENIAITTAILLDVVCSAGSYFVTKKALMNIAQPEIRLEMAGIFGMSMAMGAIVLNQMPATNVVNSIIQLRHERSVK